MPEPYGTKTRQHRFLLRMDPENDAYVRNCAAKWEVSINTAINMIIDDAKARDRNDELRAAKKEADARAAAAAAAQPPPPTRPTRRERGLKGPRPLPPPPTGFRAPPPIDGPIPGQEVIPMPTKTGRTP